MFYQNMHLGELKRLLSKTFESLTDPKPLKFSGHIFICYYSVS